MGYREVLASDATDFEKYDALIGLIWFYKNEHKDLETDELKAELEKSGTLDELKTIYEESFENDDYIKDDCLFQDGFKCASVKDKFYMVN